MAGVHDVIQTYIDIIEKHVPDPNTARATRTTGRKWIYDDLPKSSLGADKYPRISVLNKGTPSEPHALNSHQQRLNVRIEVQIRVRRSKWNNYTAEQFADDLTLKVIEALRLDSSYSKLLADVNVFQPQLEAENTTLADDLIVKTLIYKNIMRR